MKQVAAEMEKAGEIADAVHADDRRR